jgi:cell division protein FtsL
MKLFNYFLKHHQLLFGIFILAILLFISFFLYKNFYQTITYAEKISRLRTQVAQEKINMSLLEKIVTILKERKKEAHVEWESVKNPFK